MMAMTLRSLLHWTFLLIPLWTGVATTSLSRDVSSSQRPPYTITAEVVNTTSVSLKWSTASSTSTTTTTTGQDGGGGNTDDVTCPVRLFLIRLKQDESRRVRTWKVDGSRSSVSLHGLHAGTVYYVRIVAVVCDGRSKPSRWVSVRTAVEAASHRVQEDQRETSAPAQPVDVSTRTFADSVLVTWKAPEGGAIVRGYVIGYGEGVPDVSWQYLDANRRNVTIRNLKKATQYVISVRAFNNVGKGPVVYDLVYTTDSTAVSSAGTLPLSPPANLQSKVLSSTTIWLQWTDPSLGRQQMVPDSRYYNVHYQAVQPLGKALSAVARDLHVILYNLAPATKYEFKVRTVKDAQTSHYSTVITNRTFETVPSSAPRDVKVTSLNDDVTSVRVTWRHPRHANGNITEYLVFYTWNEALPSERWQVKPVFGPYTETTLYGLNATTTTFYFRVQARNMHGFGPKSDIVKLTVDQTAVTGERGTVVGQSTEPSTSIAPVVSDNNLPSSTQSTTSSSSVTNVTSVDGSDSDSDEEHDNDDEEDSHYDYIEPAKSLVGDVIDNNSSVVESNVTSSDEPQAQSGAVKAKRVPSLLSPNDPDVDNENEPIVQQAVSPTLNVAFRATVHHDVSVFLTWPASDTCQSRRTGDAVVGYQLRYRAVTPGGDKPYVVRYMTENVALLEGLSPNTRYKYQLRYVRRSERVIQRHTEIGWSQEAVFDTGSG